MSNPITPLSSPLAAVQEAQAAKEGYLHRCLVAFDIFCNVVILKGQQGETVSTHSARAAFLGKRWGIYMSAFLNWFQPDHGAKAACGDLERAENLERIEENSGIIGK
jgi:hypothetical protein